LRDFDKDREALGVGLDGQLPEAQRNNLRILFGHDQMTIDNILDRQEAIPFDVQCAIRILRVFISTMKNEEPLDVPSGDLLMAMVIAGADQVEITNNRERWSRSRRRPRTSNDAETGRTWKGFHLVSENVAGRDATLPALHSFLVERPTGRARRLGRHVHNTVVRLLTDGPDRRLVEIIEEGRGARIPDSEWRELARARECHASSAAGHFDDGISEPM